MAHPNEIENLRTLATKTFEAGNYQEAIDVFRKSLAIKEDWSSFQGLGSALLRTNQCSEAIGAFRKSLAIKEDWGSYLGLGWSLFNEHRNQEAIDAFRKSLEIKEDWMSYLGLGSTLLRTNQYSEAIDAFQKSIAFKEDYLSYQGLGSALLKSNQYADAVEAFQSSIALKEDWNSFHSLGWALLKSNQKEEAIQAFKKSVSLEEKSNFSRKDKNLTLLIGASRYNYFHKRIIINHSDVDYYSPIHNELQNFIALCPWETECLYRYSTAAKQGIVEIGRAKGGSTLIFSLSNPDVKIISIDIAPQDDKNLKNIFTKLHCGTNVSLLIGDGNEVYKDVMTSGFSYDFLFIDGDHSFEGCMKDITTWFPTLSPGGLIVFHDAFSDKLGYGFGVFEAIMEFSKENSLDFLIPPSSTSRFWENRNGSLCIAKKKTIAR